MTATRSLSRRRGDQDLYLDLGAERTTLVAERTANASPWKFMIKDGTEIGVYKGEAEELTMLPAVSFARSPKYAIAREVEQLVNAWNQIQERAAFRR